MHSSATAGILQLQADVKGAGKRCNKVRRALQCQSVVKG